MSRSRSRSARSRNTDWSIPGDTLKLGIGAMTDERVKGFFDSMVKAGVVKPDVDYKKAYTLQFVDKGVGLDLRPK